MIFLKLSLNINVFYQALFGSLKRCLNTLQHGGQTHATCYAQQCCDMLRWHVVIVWPGLKLRPNDSNATYPNIVGPVFASFGQTIVTFKHNNKTCCTRLTTLSQRVATCCELKIELVRMPTHNIVARTWPNDYNTVQHPQMLHEKFDQFHQI